VSDFLDRVAARVIGGDAAMLTPRIPSMYEPSQPPASVSLEHSLSVTAADTSPHDDEASAPARAIRLDTPTALAPSETPHEEIRSEWTQATPTRPDRVDRASVISAKEAVQPLSARHRVIEPAAHRPMRESRRKTSTHERAERSPATARVAAVPDHAIGVLLPPEHPVFGAAIADTTRHASPERGQGTAAQVQSEPREPVVHVSIGRIEVRASSPAATTVRRQDAARVDRLGDYLRERNKASP